MFQLFTTLVELGTVHESIIDELLNTRQYQPLRVTHSTWLYGWLRSQYQMHSAGFKSTPPPTSIGQLTTLPRSQMWWEGLGLEPCCPQLAWTLSTCRQSLPVTCAHYSDTHISKTATNCSTSAVLHIIPAVLLSRHSSWRYSTMVYLVTCWIASSPYSIQRRVFCVTLALICCGTCTGSGFRKESSFDLQCLLCAVMTTRHLHISLMISIGLMKRNHGIDYGPVPAHAWSFLELSSAPLAIDHFMEQSPYQRHCINFSAVFQETT